jgi:hypothetical protein
MVAKAPLAVAFSVLLALPPLSLAGSPAVVGKMNMKGRVEINGASAPPESTVFAGDRISTGNETALGLSLTGGDQVFLPSQSAVQVDRAGQQITVALERGALAVVNRSDQPLLVRAGGVEIQTAGPSGGLYEVAISGGNLKVLARKGTAMVRASNRTVEVKEGTTLEATVPTPALAAGGLGPLWTVVLVASAAAGITGLVLGVQALNRVQPQDCVVVSPNRPQIVCP